MIQLDNNVSDWLSFSLTVALITQAHLVRSAFCVWKDYVQHDCAQKQDAATHAAQKASHRHIASVFSAWLGLHHQYQDDQKSINFCRRCTSNTYDT